MGWDPRVQNMKKAVDMMWPEKTTNYTHGLLFLGLLGMCEEECLEEQNFLVV